MKIYTSPFSPFGARVTIAAKAKGIDIEVIRATRDIMNSDEYGALNPIRKIPVLVAGDDLAVVESEVVLRYLEDAYPDPALMPADAADKARVNMLIRVTDLYVMVPVTRLFAHMLPANRDQTVVDFEVAQWRKGLGFLDHFLKQPRPTAAGGLTLADCVLPPALMLCHHVARYLELPDMLAPYPAVEAYYEEAKAMPIVGEVVGELWSYLIQH